jgi:hypothetical protein
MGATQVPAPELKGLSYFWMQCLPHSLILEEPGWLILP